MRLSTLKNKRLLILLITIICWYNWFVQRIDEFFIDKRSFNLLKFELEHIKHYDFIGVDELLNKNFPDSIFNIILERLMENFIDPF